MEGICFRYNFCRSDVIPETNYFLITLLFGWNFISFDSIYDCLKEDFCDGIKKREF